MLKSILAMTMAAGLVQASPAAAAPQEVMTVLPPKSAPAEIHIKRPGGNDSACLSFDLSALPESAQQGLSVELRLVGFRSPEQRFPQIVQVFKGCNPPPSDAPIGGWRVQGESAAEAILKSSVADETDNDKVGLARTVKEALGGELQLLLRAVDDETDWKYASLATSYGIKNGRLETYNFDDEAFRSSTRPRLIVGYQVTSDDASPYKLNLPRAGFMEKVKSFTRIISGPLAFQGDLIVIAGNSDETSKVVVFAPWGVRFRSCPIQGKVGGTDISLASQLGRHSVIDGQGRLHNFGARAITTYDLRGGCPNGEYAPTSSTGSGVVPQGPPTISQGGNVYLIGSGQENYLYGLAPGSFQELWRSEKRAGTLAQRVVVSGGIVYALTPDLVRLDAASGEACPPKTCPPLKGWTLQQGGQNDQEGGGSTVDPNWNPYVPVVSPATEGDYLVLAATGRDQGRLAAFTGSEMAWEQEGPLAAQPTLARDAWGQAPLTGKVVLTVQNQRFVRLGLGNGRQICASQPAPGLVCDEGEVSQCTSNIVVDSQGTAYFLNHARLYAFTRDCEQVRAMPVEVQGDLLFPSDGHLIAPSDNKILALRATDRIAAGSEHACAILDDGSLKCWGWNWVGQLGLGDKESRGDQPNEMGTALKPVDLGSGRRAKKIAAGGAHTCALLDDGLIKCWGRNGYGQLGQGDQLPRGGQPNTMGNSLKPIDLGNVRTAQQVVVGNLHTCALLDDGSVKCWGFNKAGQLGQGDAIPRGDQPNQMGNALKPVDLGRGRTAIQIAAGDNTTCALLDEGSVKCWGGNSFGILGQGDEMPRGDQSSEMGDALKPVDLGSGRTAQQIVAGQYHACALLDDGSVKCWGYNGLGQLGQGDRIHRGDSPQEMGDALKPIYLGRKASWIGAGGFQTCAILDEGSLKCWGSNAAGQLGQGDKEGRGGNDGLDIIKPVDLGSGRTAHQVVVGGKHTCALLDDGSVKCWGYNDSGQLGLGDKRTRGDEPNEMGDALPAIDLGSGRKQ